MSIRFSKFSFLTRLLVVLLALCMVSAACAEEATAANPYLEISTQYPAITVKAGDELTFSLDIENQTGASQDVALSVDTLPEGWTGTFSTSSREVSLVHIKNEATNSSISFNLSIPLDTEDGEYEVVLKADGGQYADKVTLYLTVNAEQVGESKFSAEYPSQEGTADTAFSFDATLSNNTLTDQNYSFSSNAPDGWTVSVQPDGESTKVSAIDVEARKSQGLDIQVTAPENAEAGEYQISCTAASASEKMSIDLSVTITGSYGIELSTPSGRLSFDTYANKETAVQLTISNTGNSDLTNVNLTSSMPTGWNVRFANETIDLIEPGATVETTAYITPGEDAMSGDYVNILKVKNSKANDSVEFRVTVKTETKWGFTGVAIIVVLAACLMLIVKKYGRR